MAQGQDQQHKMSTSRCVRWILVGMANQTKEMWISDQPILGFCYLWQYAPTWAWFFSAVFGRRIVQNFKAGLVGTLHNNNAYNTITLFLDSSMILVLLNIEMVSWK